MRKHTVAFALLALLAAACSNKTTTGTGSRSSPSASPSAQPQGPQTFGVTLDGKTDSFNGEFGTFFPNSLSAHAGDTINFSLPRYSGVPHTVTVTTEEVVVVVLPETPAWLLYATQMSFWIAIVRE